MKRLGFLTLLLAGIVTIPFSSDASDPDTGAALIESVPLEPGAPEPDAPLFLRVSPEESGVTHMNPIDITHPLKRVYHSSSACGGSAIGDIDLDGKPDLFLASGPRANSLYLQKGDFEFVNVAKESGVEGG